MVMGVDPAVMVALPAGVYAGCVFAVGTPVDGVDMVGGVKLPMPERDDAGSVDALD